MRECPATGGIAAHRRAAPPATENTNFIRLDSPDCAGHHRRLSCDPHGDPDRSRHVENSEARGGTGMAALPQQHGSDTRDTAGRPLSETVWAELLGYLRNRHPELMHPGLAGLAAPVLDRGELTLEIADPALLRHLDANGRAAFAEAAQSVTGHLVSVRFIAASGDRHRPLRGGIPRPGYAALPSLNPDYVFEHFVTGPENRMAHATARAVADAPGRAYNPFFVHGSPGLGKTHLLQAICHQVLTDRPSTRVAYLTCETFVNEFIEAVQHGDLPDFRHRYRQLDLLLVDDMQFLAAGERSQDEFFHTFNAIHQSQGQIVLSADCGPAEIPHLAERLVSRFNWGMVVKLDAFSLETRIAILRTKAAVKRIDAPEDVLTCLGSAIKGNARELEGALLRLKAHAELFGEPMSIELARRVLGVDAPTTPTASVTLQRIVTEVSERFHVKPPDMRGRRRHRSVALARQACMYLARRMTAHSLEEIGDHLGRRDHSTVLHAQRVIEERRTSDNRLDTLLVEIEQRLLQT